MGTWTVAEKSSRISCDVGVVHLFHNFLILQIGLVTQHSRPNFELTLCLRNLFRMLSSELFRIDDVQAAKIQL